jgi:hypothetical protein
MMASGENRFSATMPRQMPVLARSQFCVRNACVNPLPPVITFCGGGGFVYGGADIHSGALGFELLGVVSYDSSAGGQHGGLIAGKARSFSGGVEAMRTWSNWQQTISPIGFVNGSSAIAPTNLGPLNVSSADYGGLASYDPTTGLAEIGGYLGGSGGGRAGGVGGYVSISFNGSCPNTGGASSPGGE